MTGATLFRLTILILAWSSPSPAFVPTAFHLSKRNFLFSPNIKISPPSLSSSSSPDGGSAADDALRSLTFSCLDGSPSSPDPQLLSDYLMEMGAYSASITDHDRDTAFENPIFREPNEEWSTPALIRSDAAVGTNVWRRCDVVAHVPCTVNIIELVESIRVAFELFKTPRYTVDEVPDKDWVVEVQSGWKPMVVHGFVLKFPWHEEGDVVEAVGEDWVDSMPTVTLQGGIAFGTGEHPTTQLMLKFCRRAVEEGARQILDYGTGSGVLGLAACSLSEDVTAVGVDIDADAVSIANANAEMNGLPMRSFLPPQRLLGGEQACALPADLDGPIYDACAANILAEPLIALAPTLYGLVRPGGCIGLSGVLEGQAGGVIQAYSEFFQDVKVEASERGWVLITGVRGED